MLANASFTKLKGYKRFGDFVMLVWSQRLIFFILLPGQCTGSLGVTKKFAQRSNSKLLQCCQNPYQQICYNDSEKKKKKKKT